MIELATAVGLVLVIEGLLYATAPGSLKRLMLQMQAVPDDALRIAGVAAVAIGVGLVWVARTLMGGP